MRTEVLDKITQLITIAFGLVAALAWNATILAIFEALFGTAEGVLSLLIYAVVVTVAAVFATIWLGRMSQRAKMMAEPSSKKMSEKPEEMDKAA